MSHFSQRSTDQQGVLGWLARPPTNLSVAILFLLLCLLFGVFAFEFERRGNQITAVQDGACEIQARGLPAGHDLAAAMSDLHILVTFPSTRHVPPAAAVVLADLNGALSAYLALEAKQPASKKC